MVRNKDEIAIKILREYNEWRRHEGEPYPFPHSGKELGEAIDAGIDAIIQSKSFDWLAYKAKVAAIMLPHIYQQVLKDSNKSGGLRNPIDVAIDETIDITIDMTERLERRLRNGN